MTVEAAAYYIGISRASAYVEAQRYRDSGGSVGIPNVKIGGRVLVLTEGLTALLRPADLGCRRAQDRLAAVDGHPDQDLGAARGSYRR